MVIFDVSHAILLEKGKEKEGIARMNRSFFNAEYITFGPESSEGWNFAQEQKAGNECWISQALF